MGRKWERRKDAIDTFPLDGSPFHPAAWMVEYRGSSSYPMQRIAKERLAEFMANARDKGLFDEAMAAFERHTDGDIQSHKSMVEALEEQRKEPAPAKREQDPDAFTVERLINDKMTPVAFHRGDWVSASMPSGQKSEGEIVGVSHANREAAVGKPGSKGLWHPFGAIYPAQRPEAPKKPTVPLAKVVEKVNEKSGAGLTEADRITNLASHDELLARLRDGDASLEEYRNGFEQMVKSRAVLVQELERHTKEQLLKRLPPYRTKSDSKERLVVAAYDDMLSDFALGQGVSYVMGAQDGYATALRKIVEGATTDTLKTYAEKVAKSRADYRARIEGIKKALENPETLEEFDTFAKRKGEDALTPEQLAKYDDLRAAAGRETRAQRDAAKSQVRAAGQKVGAEIVETKHTQKGHDLFVVKLADRLERADYDRLNGAAKKMGGYYSSFRGNGAIPGFQFKDRATAETFKKLAEEGDTAAATEIAAERREGRREAKKNAAAERLMEMADRMEEGANEELSKDRLTNTAKRARQAESSDADARAKAAMAKTLRNLAEAIESGEATHLDGIRTRAQVETLDGIAKAARDERLRQQYPSHIDYERNKGRPLEARDADEAVFPDFKGDRSDLLAAVRELESRAGTLRLAEKMKKLAARGDGQTRLPIPREVVEEFVAKAGEKKGPWYWAEYLARINRLEAAGIPDLATLRAAIREYVQFKDTGPKKDRVKELERALAGDKGVGIDFFPTPQELAQRMAFDLDAEPGMRVLEPSGGKGNLADAVRAQVPKAAIDVVEQSHRLREILEAKGYTLVGHDFMDFKPEQPYDRIIMNPPFSNGQDADHVRHAYDMLAPGGKLVAITGEGIFFREDAKSKAFRDWFDEVGGESEKMEGAFTDRREVKTTGVNSRLLTIEKPAEGGRARRGEAKVSGNSVATVRGWIPDFIERSKVPVRVVQSYRDAPGAHPKDRGFYVNGTIYLIADNIPDKVTAQRTAARHEAVHAGVAILYGNQVVRGRVLREIVARNPRLREIGSRWFTLFGAEHMVAAKARGLDEKAAREDARLTSWEEALAYRSEELGEPEGWRGFVAAIQRGLRKMGLGKLADWLETVTDAEARAAIAEIIRAVEHKPAPHGEPALARAATQAPVFYSELARQVEASKTESAPAAQWAATLKGMKGVKADELEWSGVLDWLAFMDSAIRHPLTVKMKAAAESAKGGKVAKQQILDFLEQNGVKVTETMLGSDDGINTTSEWNDTVVKLDALGYDVDGLNDQQDGFMEFRGVLRRSRYGDVVFYVRPGVTVDRAKVDWDIAAATKVEPFAELPEDAQPLVQRLSDISDQAIRNMDDSGAPDGNTRFSSYTLPGGQNYRELLLTLPERSRDSDPQIAKKRDRFQALMDLETGPRAGRRELTAMEIAERDRLSDELNAAGPNPYLRDDTNPNFRSSHFDTPNILAHVRFDERTDANGKRVLFIEEFQSDWAQKGKRDGFKDANEARQLARMNALREEFKALKERLRYIPAHENSDEAKQLRAREGELVDAMNKEHDAKQYGVPAAPFVGKTEAWVALALKRMIRYAAEHGFERVAWTTGEQQAERYDLSKHVDEITYRKKDEGRWAVVAWKSGRPLDINVRNDEYDRERLAETFGKDIADKIVRDEGHTPSGYTYNPDGDRKALTGLDLKVGGEGMHAFYDRIVPNVVNDVLKKLGGGRVGAVDIPSGDKWADRQAAQQHHGYTDNAWNNLTSAAQKSLIDDYAARHAQPQPGFDITPALRERAMGGLPMFARGDFNPESYGERVSKLRSSGRTISQHVSDLVHSDRTFNWWHRSWGTQYHKAQVDPDFKRVYDRAQDHVHEMSRAALEPAEQAPALLPQIDGLRGIVKSLTGAASQKDIAAIGKPVLEGTLLAEDGNPHEGRVWTDAELRGKYRLDDAQVGLYHEFRAAVDRSLDLLLLSEIANLTRGEGVNAALEAARQDPAHAGEIVGDALARQAEAMKGRARADKLDLATLIHEKQLTVASLKAHGYAPLMRFGKFPVSAYEPGKDGKHETRLLLAAREQLARPTR
jgi:phospholipid N-methyltransferase